MHLLDRRVFMAAAAGAGAAAAGLAKPAHAGLASADIFTADASGALVDSTVILGERNAVLIDAQLTAPNAAALADVIAATGRRLETVFITHAHPDHHLGLRVILDRFPEAKAFAHPKIQSQLAIAAQWMLTSMSASAPDGTYARSAIAPQPLSGDVIMLEGERLEILEPMHGDTDLISPVHIPALDTLIASDVVFSGIHCWMAENTSPERVQLWRDSLDRLEAIGAGTVIPGHEAPGGPRTPSVFAATRAYLDQWEQALQSAASPEELRAAMMAGNDALALDWVLDMSVAAVYPS